MKNLILFAPLLSLIMIWGCCTSKNVDSKIPQDSTNQSIINPDSIAKETLGDSLVNVLFKPDSVLVSRLIDKSEKSQFEHNRAFQPEVPFKKLSEEDLAMLQLMLLANHRNYANDTIIVMSPCIPAMEIDFFKNDSKLKIWVSFSDHTWMIISEDGKQMLNYNYVVETPLSEIYQKL